MRFIDLEDRRTLPSPCVFAAGHLRTRRAIVGFLALILTLGFVGSNFASADMVLTANDPGSQASLVSGVTTQSFDSTPTGKYSTLDVGFGTLASSDLAILTADSYGGAGGTGHYFSVGKQSGATSATLTLNASEAYFGMWWSAADANNKLTFLSKGQTVATFDSASALSALSSAYKGNPNNSQDTGEKFAYLNFFGTNGTTFDQIIFSNASTATGFESDNWSVRAQQVDPPYPGTAIPGLPEPTSVALMSLGVAGAIGMFFRKSPRVGS